MRPSSAARPIALFADSSPTLDETSLGPTGIARSKNRSARHDAQQRYAAMANVDPIAPPKNIPPMNNVTIRARASGRRIDDVLVRNQRALHRQIKQHASLGLYFCQMINCLNCRDESFHHTGSLAAG